MTTPKASRQRVAVSSSEYSIGLRRLRPLGRSRAAPRRVGSEVLAALLVVAIVVEAGARGRQQHHLARPGVARPRCEPPSRERRAAAVLDPGRPRRREVGLEPLGGRADQVGGCAALATRRRRARRSRSPLSEPPRIARTPPSNERSAAVGRGDVGRLGVVDVERRRRSRRPRSSRCGTPSKLAQARARSPRADPQRRSAAAAAAAALRALWAPEQPQLVGPIRARRPQIARRRAERRPRPRGRRRLGAAARRGRSAEPGEPL